ncbi:hypothetical protein AMJ85_00240 [candidate division BRC1 bacterium SM23_51]|nr:MAG: hypothetical protein AMJ85_00240 [candidate division BRC1 bacterium SM23_51]
MATTTILESTFSHTLREELLPNIYERGVIRDPVYAMAKRTWSNVVRNDGLGRDYKVKKVWGMGTAGGGSFGSPLGSDMINDATWSFSAFGTPETWPGYDEVSAPTFLTSEVQLVKHKLNLFVPRDILQTDRLNSSIGAVIPFYVKGLSKLALQQELGTFYSTLPTTVALASIGDASTTVTDVSGDTGAINVDLSGASSSGATGRIHRFEKGMLVDLYDETGTTKRNSNFLVYVDNVDHAAQVVRLRRIDGGELQDSTPLGGGINYDSDEGDDDIIVLKDSIGFTPGTMAAWVADGTDITTFFGITVANHSEFKSIKRDILGAPLTESILNSRIGYFKESFRDGDLPRGITTSGVLLGFIENIDSNVQGATDGGAVGVYGPRFRYERNGRAVDVEAGWDRFNYRYGGRRIEISTSTYMEKGRFQAGMFDIDRYVPPPIPGTRMDQRIGDEMQFLASSGSSAYDSIFTRYDHNGKFSNLLQAPAERKSVMMPRTPNYLLLHNIAEISGFDGT